MITQELVKHLFDYENGILTWKNPMIHPSRKGCVVGSKNSRGCLIVQINSKMYLVHRLIYLYHHGNLPKYVDHIDRDPLNNKIENLRECTLSQNNCNQKSRNRHKNVYWNKRDKKWTVYITINKKMKHIGGFDDFELAKLVAVEARNKYYKEFARHV